MQLIENNMSALAKYEARRQELIKRMETFSDFEKNDLNVHKIVEIARAIIRDQRAMQNIHWLLQKGGQLAGYYGYLPTKGNEAWAEYKAAEIAFKEIRDALMLSHKVDKHTITEAKASAARETGEIEIDVIVKEKRARDYEAVSSWCQAMLSFIQSTLRQLENERGHSRIADRGKKQ